MPRLPTSLPFFCSRIPLEKARYYFHEVTFGMMCTKGFPSGIKRSFLQALTDDLYKEKYVSFAAFSDSHFLLLVSYCEFSPLDFSDSELMKILALCEEDMKVQCGLPCEIDIDRLCKYRLKLA